MTFEELGNIRTSTFIAGSGSGLSAISDLESATGARSKVAAVFAPTSGFLNRFKEYAAFDYFGTSKAAPRHEESGVVLVEPWRVEIAKPKMKFVSDRRTVTCEIEEVLRDSFTAIYWDEGSGARRVRFNLAWMTPDDQALVVPRAEFHWSVGTEVREDGRQATTSIVIFRRQPKISKERWNQALEDAEKNAVVLGWELFEPDES